ncbi:MAG: methyltransferase domain-containing protein [Candidatus Omnitrophica bacterium]|nr:methyltransferase domain-containing protein [Candidatus Omnitrophota bacterium]
MNNIFRHRSAEYDAWYEKNRQAYLSELEAVKRLFPSGGRGLEIGVGSGRFAGPLGISEGVDNSPEMLEAAKSRGVRVRLADAEDLPYEDRVFDHASMIFTLCFVEDPDKTLEEAARVLKDNGVLVTGIVDRESSLGRSYLSKKSPFYLKARFFSVPEVTSLLEKHGFADLSYCQALFDLPENIRKVEIPLDGYGKGGFVVVRGVKTGH